MVHQIKNKIPQTDSTKIVVAENNKYKIENEGMWSYVIDLDNNLLHLS